LDFLYIFLGGGLGAMARFGISKLINFNPIGFPWATFTSNIISCIFLGILFGIAIQKNLDQKYQLLLMTGFCGGFSTFSTYSLESFNLIENGQLTIAILYMFTSTLVCLLCIFLGFWLIK